MSNLKITAMDHIVLNVAEVERSLAFYTDILRLRAERVDEFRAGKVTFPSVRINEGTLIDLLLASPDSIANPAASEMRQNLAHFCLVTEPTDLDVLANELEGQGVTITTRPASRWGARGQAMSIYLLDPDGNEIEIRHY